MIDINKIKNLTVEVNQRKELALKEAALEKKKQAELKKLERITQLKTVVTSLVNEQLTEERLLNKAREGQDTCHVFTAFHKHKYTLQPWSIEINQDEYKLVRETFKSLIEPKGFTMIEQVCKDHMEERHYDDYMTIYATEGVGYHVSW